MCRSESQIIVHLVDEEIWTLFRYTGRQWLCSRIKAICIDLFSCQFSLSVFRADFGVGRAGAVNGQQRGSFDFRLRP